MKFINTIKENEKIKSIYLVKNKSVSVTKAGNDYFNVVLQDKTGTLDGKVWDINSEGIEDFEIGDFVEVIGDVINYNNLLQCKIERIRVASSSEYKREDFFVTTKKDIEEMKKDLISLINEVEDKNYNRVLKLVFIEDEEFLNKFSLHQGAKNVHHSFIGGLMEHTLSVTNIAKKICENYEYVDKNLVITAALLHDIGKVYEICDYPVNDYTDEGQLLGHIIIGINKIQEKINLIDGFDEIKKNQLLHCIASHHGQLEFGSPKLPGLMEALIVSSADNLDSKVEIMREGIEGLKLAKKNEANSFIYSKFLNTNFRETKK